MSSKMGNCFFREKGSGENGFHRGKSENLLLNNEF